MVLGPKWENWCPFSSKSSDFQIDAPYRGKETKHQCRRGQTAPARYDVPCINAGFPIATFDYQRVCDYQLYTTKNTFSSTSASGNLSASWNHEVKSIPRIIHILYGFIAHFFKQSVEKHMSGVHLYLLPQIHLLSSQDSTPLSSADRRPNHFQDLSLRSFRPFHPRWSGQFGSSHFDAQNMLKLLQRNI